MSNPLCNGEEALYDWPCKRCKKPFRPRRMTSFPTAPFQQCCDKCQTLNLLEMIFQDDSENPRTEAEL